MIFELSLARADATPPAETVPVAKLTLMMSHRMWWLPAEALKLGEGPAFAASTVEAGVPLSHPRAMPISATPASPALKVRAFIMCSSFCVFLLLRPVTLCQQRCSGAEVAHGPCRGGNTFAVESELGERREATYTDSGVEPAGRIAARRTAVTPGDLATATAPRPHQAGCRQAASRSEERRVGK